MNSTGRRSRVLAMGVIGIAIVAAASFITLTSAPARVFGHPDQHAGTQTDQQPPAQETVTPATAAHNAEALTMAQAMSTSFEQTAAKASPAVVFIQVEKQMKVTPAAWGGPENGPMDPQDMFKFFFGPGQGGPGPGGLGKGGRHMMPEPNQCPVPFGQGSGFIISADGYIVTNNHVVGDADRVKVTLQDGREFTAKRVGSDPDTEIALIKIDATGLPTLTLANSDHVRVGEWVLAIGSPFGLDHSVTSGIVSARGRSNVGIVDYADFIQTDAAINPGNSGGPLLDLNGEVIGMNTAIASHSGGSNGVGFAIPSNMITFIVDQLREHGTISRGFLGISIQNLTPDLAKWFGVKDGHGILIADVAKDSPAEKAGLQRDDLIVEVNGSPVGETGAFRSHVATTPSGKKIELGILRGGNRITKSIEIGSKPAEHVALGDKAQPEGESDLGISVQGLTDDLAKRLGYEGESGVVVAQVEPGSAAARAGIQPGALIEEVNKQKVENPREFEQALKKDPQKHSALLLLKEGQTKHYVALENA
jgi:serine protease Do